MPMCSDQNAVCGAVHTPIKKLYKCPFELPSGFCDSCCELEYSDGSNEGDEENETD